MVIRVKKYEAGEAVRYITRRGALKKLQVTLKQFRTLCILKGVYPREPIKRKRAQRGKPGVKILYYKKDINFLLHEPNLVIMRQQRALFEKLKSKKELHDHIAKKKLKTNFPFVKLNHIVKERYPTFIDALRDMDDALTLCILIGRLPGLKRQRLGQDKGLVELCQRLPVEFMHAVIHARALRKVFISIKGFYFQAEFKGQKVTWIIPHLYGHQPYDKKQIDIRTMLTFAEFYTSLLGFTLYRLYHTLNLAYPPTFSNCFRSLPASDKEVVDKEILHSERVAALNMDISVNASGMSVPAASSLDQEEEEGADFDYFPTNAEADAEKVEAYKREAEKVRKLKRLFEGLKVFLNREVPREPLTLALRSFGAKVSWDKTMFVGATFPEDDETITHQIVDRPSIGKQYISRYYVQPQWVFDSINAKELVPVEKYFLGVTLPPHLSPFIDTTKTEHYVPPEAEDPENEALRDPKNIQTLSKVRKGPRQLRQQQAEEDKKREEEKEREELENAKKCSDTEEEEDEGEDEEEEEEEEEAENCESDDLCSRCQQEMSCGGTSAGAGAGAPCLSSRSSTNSMRSARSSPCANLKAEPARHALCSSSASRQRLFSAVSGGGRSASCESVGIRSSSSCDPCVAKKKSSCNACGKSPDPGLVLDENCPIHGTKANTGCQQENKQDACGQPACQNKPQVRFSDETLHRSSSSGHGGARCSRSKSRSRASRAESRSRELVTAQCPVGHSACANNTPGSPYNTGKARCPSAEALACSTRNFTDSQLKFDLVFSNICETLSNEMYRIQMDPCISCCVPKYVTRGKSRSRRNVASDSPGPHCNDVAEATSGCDGVRKRKDDSPCCPNNDGC
uniref:Pescadillo homolog n=1 Tax=Cacopsylla melanoneura TaxID=428564 RepID=A0A8D9A9M4_9HEMI